MPTIGRDWKRSRLDRRLCGNRRFCPPRSEEHTSELQSRQYLVCRLLLEKNIRQRTSDRLLKSVSKRISSLLRTVDTMGRIERDMFLVLFEESDHAVPTRAAGRTFGKQRE